MIYNYAQSVKTENPPIEPPLAPPQISPSISHALPPPRESNIFKYFFYFSLIIFLIVLGLVINSLLQGQKSLPLSKTPSISPSPAPACLLNNEHIQIGQAFPSSDGCNTCSCTPDLTIVCTEKACSPTPTSEPQKSYQNKAFNFSLEYPQNYKLSDKLPLKYAKISSAMQFLSLINSKTNSSLSLMVNPDGFGPTFPNETGVLSYSPSSGTEISGILTPDNKDYQSRNPDSLKMFIGEYSGKIGDNNFLITIKTTLPDDGQNQAILKKIINSITAD
jgi:hypothetical protein